MSNTNIFEDEDALRVYTEEIVTEYVSNPFRTSFGFRASCPICNEGSSGKRKKRFQFYRDSYSGFCFNSGCPCSEKGLTGLNLTSTLKNIPLSMENSEYAKWYQRNYKKSNNSDVLKYQPQQEIGFAPPSETTIKERVVATQEDLFEDTWVDLPPAVVEYCNQRRMFNAPFAPDNWKLYLDIATKRLVIPWMEEGEIVYYQKRALLKGDDPKYIYPSGTHRPIFNVDKIDESFPYIFVTEGAIDCCFLKNGIACGGLTPSNEQKEELRERFPGFKIVILTDNQWVDRSAKLALNGDWRAKTNGLLKTVMYDYLFFIWPKGETAKDINESVCNDSTICKFHDKDWLLKHTYDALQAKFIMMQ